MLLLVMTLLWLFFRPGPGGCGVFPGQDLGGRRLQRLERHPLSRDLRPRDQHLEGGTLPVHTQEGVWPGSPPGPPHRGRGLGRHPLTLHHRSGHYLIFLVSSFWFPVLVSCFWLPFLVPYCWFPFLVSLLAARSVSVGRLTNSFWVLK